MSPAAGEARQILEDHARQHWVSRLRLDTRADLIEARQLYGHRGYREAHPFSRGPYAECWYDKTLPCTPTERTVLPRGTR